VTTKNHQKLSGGKKKKEKKKEFSRKNRELGLLPMT
jgi:hypothetical protein